MKRATIKGFIVLDYIPRFGEALRDMGRWLKEGKIQYRVDGSRTLLLAPFMVSTAFFFLLMLPILRPLQPSRDCAAHPPP